MASNVRLTDGSWNWAGGVDSGKSLLIASNVNPGGLRRDQLAWLTNATLRGGGIIQRTGWQPLCTVHPGAALYQGGWLYDNSLQDGNPYLMLSIGGGLYQVRVDTDNSVTDVATGPGLTDPAGVPQAYFTQGEEFLIKQAGDGVTLPLIWDGTTLRRSTGPAALVGVTAADFVVPAVGTYVDVTLAGAYAGAVNAIVMIEGQTYLQVTELNFATLVNVADVVTGATMPAGTPILDGIGATVAVTLVNFLVPAVGAPVAVPVLVTPQPAGPFPQAVTLLGNAYQFTEISPTGANPAAPAANHVYLINLTDVPAATVAFPVNLVTVAELPAATAMDYYMGRIWYAQDRQYTAGDIVLGPAGTTAYRKRDSILKITENPLALAGDGFVVPTSDGLIRALKHSANLDSALGEGQLFVYTRKAIYSLNVPVKRSEWITAVEPLQRVAQNRNGTYGERSVVSVNGDLFYQGWDGMRSLFIAIRDFSQWGNTPISRNINRVLNFNDRALMSTASGIYFDNRMLQTVLPYATDVGTAFQALAVLDFDTVSSLDAKDPPAWEGAWQGVDILQLFEGDFGGLQRAFAVVRSSLDGSIQVWELTASQRRDKDDARVTWQVETPAFDWGKTWELKKLDGGEIWLDRIFGTVDVDVYYRPDAETCWQFWNTTSFCSARSSAENLENPVSYPEQPYGENYKFPITLPTPPAPDCQTMNKRPLNLGYQFQVKLVIKGWCQVRGILLHALPVLKAPFEGMAC